MSWLLAWLACVALLGALALLIAARRRVREQRLERRFGLAEADETEQAVLGYQRLQRIRNRPLRALCRWLWSAGVAATPVRVGQYAALWLVVLVLAIVAAGTTGLALAFALPVIAALLLGQRKRARRARINRQLPAFLGHLLRALSAGNTFEQGLYASAIQSSEPLRGVFLSVSRQIRLGAAVDEVLTDVARIHQLRALHVLAMGAGVNRRYGGSMRRVIASLVDTISQQEAAARELKALTGETRLSAYVVAAIPVVISLFFYLRNPDYYTAMLASPGGRVAIIVALLLEAFGLMLIWRMVSRLQAPAA